MRRLVFGFVAALTCLAASNASAGWAKKSCAPCAAPAPVYETACEPCAPAPVVCEAPAKECCFKPKMPKICLPKIHMPKMHMPKFGCHKKAVACEVAETCNTCETTYAAPQSATWAAPQSWPAAQAKSLPVPQK